VNDRDPSDEPLQELARRLGARAAARLDVERAATAVLQRLRERPAEQPVWWIRPAWLRLAAAVVLVVGVGVLYRDLRPPASQPDATTPAAEAGLTELSSDQLRGVLQALDQVDEVAPASSQEAGLEELDSAQLRELLRSLEG